MTYNIICFLAADTDWDGSFSADLPEMITVLDGHIWQVDAETLDDAKQIARENLARILTDTGYNVTPSNTTSEVYAVAPDGCEHVFYGFDEP